MDTNIISSIIGASGAIIAAISAALIAKGIIKKDIKPIFQTYSDETHNLSSLLKKAQHNIVIFAGLGDRFLEEYEIILRKKLHTGIHVYYLFLDENNFPVMEQYMCCNNSSNTVYSDTKGRLLHIKNQYPNTFHLKLFPHFMTASYIGIDIPFNGEANVLSAHSIIQVTYYLYHCRTNVSPIQYISNQPRTQRFFDKTVYSMQEMWRDSVGL